MMTIALDRAPYLALVDDDSHSARLLIRMLEAHGAPHTEWLGDAEDGRARLERRLSAGEQPSMLIVDLKSRSTATRDFLLGLRSLAEQNGLLVVAMALSLERAEREELLAAGAAAVFQRQAERDAYRREAASIVGFWARSQRLDAVGM